MKTNEESTHCKQVLVITELFNIVTYDCRQKSVLRTSCRVLVVTELVVSGTQCKSHCMKTHASAAQGGGAPGAYLRPFLGKNLAKSHVYHPYPRQRILDPPLIGFPVYY